MNSEIPTTTSHGRSPHYGSWAPMYTEHFVLPDGLEAAAGIPRAPWLTQQSTRQVANRAVYNEPFNGGG